MEFKKIKNVPDWATTYLLYGDDSGISVEDKDMVDKWVSELKNEGLTLVSPIDNTENEFVANPVFGLASGTVDWYASEN